MLEATSNRSPSGTTLDIYHRRPGFVIEKLDAEGEGDQYLVRYQNGKFVQITEKLKDVLDQIDGESSLGEIAERLSARWQMPVTPQDVEGVVQRFLSPYSLVATPNEQHMPTLPPEKTWRAKWRDKLLLQDFFFSFKLIPASVVSSVAKPAASLFALPFSVAVLALFAATNWYLYREVGQLKEAGQMALTSPLDYLLILTLSAAGVLFHELGHAAAVTKFGGRPDAIGFGLYFIYPALYADVNESWKFSRRQRIVVDLAGIYFQIIAMNVFWAAYLLSHDIIFIYAVLFSEALALYSAVPFFKFDGYWCLADGLGVPSMRKRAFQLLYYRASQLFRGKAHGRLPGHLSLRPTVELGLLLYAASSLVFFGFVVWGLSSYAPSLFMEYPDFFKSSLRFLNQNVASGLFSQAGIVLIRLFLRTFVLLGLTLVFVSLGISLQQTMKRVMQRRT